MNQKTVFVIPGFKHTPKNRAYKEIAKMLKREGYRPILINIPWKQTTISENTEFFLKQFKKIQTKKKYILGFSFGAMIAFVASTKVNVSGLILCSLSPYFKEDIRSSNLHFGTLVEQVKTKQVHVLYGEKETKPLIKRAKKAYKEISSKRKYLVSIQKVEHDIANKRYLSTIQQVAQNLV